MKILKMKFTTLLCLITLSSLTVLLFIYQKLLKLKIIHILYYNNELELKKRRRRRSNNRINFDKMWYIVWFNWFYKKYECLS